MDAQALFISLEAKCQFHMRVSVPGLIIKSHYSLLIRESVQKCQLVLILSFSIVIGHKAAADRTGKETCKGFEKTSGQFSVDFCTLSIILHIIHTPSANHGVSIQKWNSY